MLGALDHRAELEHLELAAVLPDPPLAEEDGAAVVELDRERRSPAAAGRTQSGREGRQRRDVKRALQPPGRPAQARSGGVPAAACPRRRRAPRTSPRPRTGAGRRSPGRRALSRRASRRAPRRCARSRHDQHAVDAVLPEGPCRASRSPRTGTEPPGTTTPGGSSPCRRPYWRGTRPTTRARCRAYARSFVSGFRRPRRSR